MADKAEAGKSKEFVGYSSFQEFYQNLLKTVVQCTRASNEMARSHDDHEFWTSFGEYKEFCAAKGVETLNMIGDILHHQGLHCKWQQATARRYPHTDIDDRFDSVVEGNDMLLERVDSQLDEILCPSKANKPLVSANAPVSISVVSSWNKQTGRRKEKSDQWRKFNLLTARNIQRPQLKWKKKVDNSNAPFVPILTVKPNAIKEWRPAERFREQGIRTEVASALEDFIHQQRMGEDFNMFEDRHPYKFELDAFEPRSWQLEKRTEQPCKPLDETPLTIIDDVEGLQELLEKLKQVKEIAIDLEHHSYRSFMGFTCLMQISTRQEDFLVDTISLREELYVLNEVFTDPDIVKVLHGADKDIEWLQRDFGIYIVNMFDTGQASKVMQLERHSLAFLLSLYCQVDANKQYQLADWRLRPIPDEMVKYAREDTHYLLYIYDKMRITLLSKSNGEPNILKAVYSMSKAVCARIYEKPIFTPDTYLDICNKYKRHLNPQQLHCMKLLVAWRDHTAREEDESYGYVLPNHMMIRIAEQLPKEFEGVLACCNPVPPLVKQNVAEIYTLVKEARLFDPRKISKPDYPITSSSSNDPQLDRATRVETLEGEEFSSTAQTGFEIYPVFGLPIQMRSPSIPIFADDAASPVKTDGEKKARFILDSFRSPFELYLPKPATDKSVTPSQINEKWVEASKTQLKKVKVESPSDEETSIKEKTPPKRDMIETVSSDEQLTSLRDELPKKKKKSNNEAPEDVDSLVKFSYEKAATGTEFVPFDYSKATIKRPNSTSNSSQNKNMAELGKITEEPVRKGPVNDRRKFTKSGERSMTFKR